MLQSPRLGSLYNQSLDTGCPGNWLFVTKAVPEVGWGRGDRSCGTLRSWANRTFWKALSTAHLCVHHTTYFSSALQGLVRERIFHTVEFGTIVIGKMRSQKTTLLHRKYVYFIYSIFICYYNM